VRDIGFNAFSGFLGVVAYIIVHWLKYERVGVKE